MKYLTLPKYLTARTALSTTATEIENKIPDATGFITTPEFNRITKIIFDARMKQEAKSLTRKSQVDTARDIADKNREKNRKASTIF